MDDRDLEWEALKASLGPEKWTVGESATYRGFFNHGYDARHRPSGELVTREAIEEMLSRLEFTSRDGLTVHGGKNRLVKAVYALQLPSPVAEVPSVDLSGVRKWDWNELDMVTGPGTSQYIRVTDLENLLTHTRPDMGKDKHDEF